MPFGVVTSRLYLYNKLSLQNDGNIKVGLSDELD